MKTLLTDWIVPFVATVLVLIYIGASIADCSMRETSPCKSFESMKVRDVPLRCLPGYAQ